MQYIEFLTRVIDEGIASATDSYAEKDPAKLRGALLGFEACREKSPAELRALLSETARRADKLVDRSKFSLDDYWEARSAAGEIEWVCNVVSAALTSAGALPIVAVTVRGFMKAASILGVAEVAASAP